MDVAPWCYKGWIGYGSPTEVEYGAPYGATSTNLTLHIALTNHQSPNKGESTQHVVVEQDCRKH